MPMFFLPVSDINVKTRYKLGLELIMSRLLCKPDGRGRPKGAD